MSRSLLIKAVLSASESETATVVGLRFWSNPSYTRVVVDADNEVSYTHRLLKKETYIKKMLELFNIDGVIYHDAKTCPNNTNCRYGMPQRLEQQTDIPSLIINADLNDMRMVSDEQTKTNVEAFIEQLEENQS